jgi:hypothetical protein
VPAIETCSTSCCVTAVNTQVPGAAGQNAYTVTTANFTVPAIGATVVVAVSSTDWMAKGETVFASDGTDWGHFTVTSINSSISVTLTFQGQANDASPGAIIGSGAAVVASGEQMTIAALKALNATLLTGIAAFTDNTGGTASDTLAAGVGIFDWTFYVSLPDVTNADLIGAFTPGYAFKVLKVDFLHEKAVTTGAKAATLTPKINGSAITGGVLALAGTYAAGAVTAASTITAANIGTSAQTFSITGSGVTAFTEGNGTIRVRVQNLDTLNAIASLADKTNDIRSALQT